MRYYIVWALKLSGRCREVSFEIHRNVLFFVIRRLFSVTGCRGLRNCLCLRMSLISRSRAVDRNRTRTFLVSRRLIRRNVLSGIRAYLFPFAFPSISSSIASLPSSCSESLTIAFDFSLSPEFFFLLLLFVSGKVGKTGSPPTGGITKAIIGG